MKSKNNTAQHLLLAKTIALSFGLAVAGLSTQSSQAATQTWSGSASGVWDTSALNWDSGAAAWASSNDALFTGTPANNVTTATGLTIGAITLDNTFAGSVTMTGANTVSGATTISGGTLNLNNATGLGTSAVTINSGGTAAINVGSATVANAFSGAGILNTTLPSGANSLTLSGDLSGFTGTLNVGIGSGGGKLQLSNASTAPSSSATINVATNGTLYVFNPLSYGSSLILNGGTTGEALGQLRIEGGANWTGGVTLKADSSIGANTGTATISGVIGENGGSFGFNKRGNGTTVISGNNTYSGTTTVSGGTLSVGHNSALGTGSVAFNGGTLANTTNVTLANNLSTASGSGNITASGGTMVINGNITGARGLTLNPTNKITLAGTNNFGTAATGSNTFFGLNVNTGAGGVDITGSTTIGPGGATDLNGGFAITGTSTVTLQSGGSLTINGSGTTAATIPNSIVGQLAGTGTLLVNGGTLTVGANSGFVLANANATAAGVLTISSGTATINRGSVGAANGTDTRLIEMGKDNNTATGTINLNGGTLATDRQFVRDGSSAAGSGIANFVFGGGTLKALGAQTDWLQSTTATSGGQGGGTVNANALALSSVTTTSAASAIDSNGFSVAINSAISGGGGFNINSSTGTGTVTFGGANSYLGVTSVASGKLLVNGSNSGGGAYNVGASGTLGGPGSVGLSTINVSGVLSPGASVETFSSGTVNFATGSTFAHELNSAVAAATGADLQVVSGDLSLTGLVNLTLADLAASPGAFTPGTTFSLINYSGSWNGGTFTFGGNALADETTFTAGLNTWQIDYNAATGGSNFTGEYLGGTDSFVNLTAIPEPASMLLGGLGLLALLRRRRK